MQLLDHHGGDEQVAAGGGQHAGRARAKTLLRWSLARQGMLA